MPNELYTCLACRNNALSDSIDLSSWTLVSSDCRPRKASALITVCSRCQTIQKVPSPEWQNIIEDIYQTYQIYHQSAGQEQKIPSQGGEGLERRSKVLLERMLLHIDLPQNGAVLDYGCGNGALLRSFRELKPDWKISGADIGGHFRDTVLGISEGSQFYNVATDEIDQIFEVISLLHCLEHLTDGLGTLQRLAEKLTSNGFLFIQVPNVKVNPFDILIYDHIFHFTPETLIQMLRQAGFERIGLLSSEDEKEISIVAGPRRS